MSESNCNLCLAVNRRTINIMKTHLQLLYEKLANFKVSPNMMLCVCNVCHLRLRQCHQLSLMAKRSRCFLTTGLLQANIKLKTSSAGLVNLSCTETAQFIVPDPNSTSTVEILVKKEPSLNKEDFKFNTQDLEYYNDMENTEDWYSGDAGEFGNNVSFENGDARDNKKHMACFKNKVEIEINPLSIHGIGIKEEIIEREIKQEIVEDETRLDHRTDTILYTCRVCNHMFSTISLLNKHKLTHSTRSKDKSPATKKVPCPICGKNYADRKTLTRHMRIHSDSRPFACEICGKGFTRKDHYTKHRVIHTERACRLPGRVPPDVRLSDPLPDPDLALAPSACDVCGETFPRWDLYHQHKTNIHGITLFPEVTVEEGPSPAPEPPTEVKRQRPIKKPKPPVAVPGPKRRRRRREEFACDRCPMRFEDKFRLQNHVMTRHRAPTYECDACGKVFLRRANLGLHLRVHTGERVYCCDVCGKTFTYKSSLNVHRRVHSGDKPYSCEVCDKRFTAYGQLAEHKLVHSDARPFACDVCGKTFKRRRHLKKHLTYHSGEKPYTCDVCCRSFTRNDNYAIHMRIHTGEKPFVCDVCGVTFSENRHLKKHKIVHE